MRGHRQPYTKIQIEKITTKIKIRIVIIIPIIKDYKFVSLTESDWLKEKNIYIAPLLIKGITQGLFIIIENEHVIDQNDLDIINQFKKFIIKQLDR